MPVSLTAIPKILELALDAIKDLAPDEWDGSIQEGSDDPEEIVVQIMDGGVNGEKAWCKTRFQHGGATHLLQASGPLKTFGQRGGNDEIKYDGVVQDGGDLVIKLTVWKLQLRISGSYKIKNAEGKQVRWRFDGSLS